LVNAASFNASHGKSAYHLLDVNLKLIFLQTILLATILTALVNIIKRRLID
jgi:hypothetical protein